MALIANASGRSVRHFTSLTTSIHPVPSTAISPTKHQSSHGKGRRPRACWKGGLYVARTPVNAAVRAQTANEGLVHRPCFVGCVEFVVMKGYGDEEQRKRGR